MDYSILVAQILAVVYLAVGVGLLLNVDYYHKQVGKLVDDAGFKLINGFLAIVFGLLVLRVNSAWVKDWTILITITGWVSLVKGVTLMALPQSVQKLNRLLSKGMLSKFFAPLCLILGLIFAYYGFAG